MADATGSSPPPSPEKAPAPAPDPPHPARPAGAASSSDRPRSPFAPLAEPLFRNLWLATVVSNIGTWINDTTSAWVMTGLASSPLLVSLVQAATTLPICLLALPAGTLADIVDRRRLLLMAQSWMALAATGLAAAAALGLLGPAILLALTFALGIGAALTMPAWAASIPELVGREKLAAAISLGAVAINIARAVGPALGGLIVAALGAAPAYALNAASFLGVLVVLATLRRAPTPTRLPPEAFVGALLGGLRYARQSPVVHAVLVRSSSFFVFGSALWALLPVVARHELRGDAALYGGLLALVGLGALLAVVLLPRLLRRVSRNRITVAAQVLYAGTLAALGTAPVPGLVLPGMLLAGATWLTMMTSFQVTAQTGVPPWVRARALSLNIVVFAGSMAGGSALWGAVASAYGTNAALVAAGVGAAATAVLGRWFALAEGGADAITIAADWPEPIVLGEVENDRGPVLITVEYRIGAEDQAAFLIAIHRLRRIRRRDGAIRWRVFEDAAQPGLFVETFLVPSWLEHLRQHERMTLADRALQDQVRRFHRAPGPPPVRHLLAASPIAGVPAAESARGVSATETGTGDAPAE